MQSTASGEASLHGDSLNSAIAIQSSCLLAFAFLTHPEVSKCETVSASPKEHLLLLLITDLS